MQKLNYTLPEFVFLDGNSHLGNTLEHRLVIQHIRSYTILEVIAETEVSKIKLEPEAQRFLFEYKNSLGVIEKHLFVVHFTLGSEFDLPEVLEKCRQWYCDYLTWEDKNIHHDTISKHN